MSQQLEFFHKSEFAPIPLGLDSIVMGYLKSHHYIDLVDSLLPPNSNDLGLSWGELCALAITRLISAEKCYLTKLPHYAASIPMAAWLEREDVDPTMFNRNAVGAMLDSIAEFGADRFYTALASSLLYRTELQNIEVASIGSSSVSYLIHGSPNAVEPNTSEKLAELEEYWGEDLSKIEIKLGGVRGKQAQESQGRLDYAYALVRPSNAAFSLPIFQQLLSENDHDLSASGSGSAQNTEQSLAQLKDYLPHLRYVVADYATDTASTASLCKQKGLELITRLPNSLAVVKRVFTAMAEAEVEKGKVSWQIFEPKADADAAPASDETILLSEMGSHALTNRKDKSLAPVEGKMIVVRAESKEQAFVLWCSDLNLDPQQAYRYYQQQAGAKSVWGSAKAPQCFVDSLYINSAQRQRALCSLLSVALLVQQLILKSFHDYLRSSGQAVPRASHNKPTQTPAWGTLCDGISNTRIVFNFASSKVEAAIVNGFAIGFLLQAKPEIQKMYSAEFLSSYSQAIQNGFSKFAEKQGQLASGVAFTLG